jgi:lysophospholipase L1-like esterase
MRPLHLVCVGLLGAVALPLAGCGGGSGGGNPDGPSGPSEPTYQVSVTLFYDENGNGVLDGDEAARVPGVDVVIGSARATSAPGTGQAVVTGIPAGAYTVQLRPETIPTFYQAADAIPVQVPGTTAVSYPLVLPIGNNKRSVYLAYGDSITRGDGSSDGKGYPPKLQNLLGPWFGRAEVRNRGRDADTSAEGADIPVIRGTLRQEDPAYTLVMMGTNDWTGGALSGCQDDVSLCDTIDNLRTILDEVKAWHSLPVISTLTPSNPAVNADRNVWIDAMNQEIRTLAQQEGALLVDANAAFKAHGDLSALFADGIHPNDAGYDVLAQAWFDGITRGRAEAASRRRAAFGLLFAH